LDIRHMKTLLALRDTGSLVGAAERVHLTQSALSHQLKELEARLGAELFVRKSRPLRFTPVGQRLLTLAEEVLARVEDAERDIQQLLQGEAGRLYMAIECHSCFNWLMPTIERYRSRWPNVELDFSSGFTFEPLPALLHGDIDLVVTADPRQDAALSYLPLFCYEMQFALALDHPLLAEAHLRPQHLREQTLISYPVARERLDVFNRFLQPAGVEPAAVRQTELTLMMVQLVASGRGLAALPNWVLDDYVKQGLIAVRPAGPEGVWPNLYAALRREDARRPYVQEFVKLARRHCLDQLPGVRPVTEAAPGD